MFDGNVQYTIGIRDKCISFPRLEYKPNKPHIASISLDARPQDTILSQVFLKGVSSQAEGLRIAEEAIHGASNRLAYLHSISVEYVRSAGESFVHLIAPP
jgi:hypothetical protein